MSGSAPNAPNVLDALDRRLINALQDGFPIAERPFSEVADRLGMDERR
jgi:DNA-binding Lrp family transcriptional regulator